MKDKMLNSVKIQGYVYEHSLEIKTVKSEKKPDGTPNPNFGKSYIGGKLKVQIDEDAQNIVEVEYTYVTPTTKAGSENRTYTALNTIITENKTVMNAGKEGAIKVKVDTSLDLNDFFTNRNGTVDWELVSARIYNGGFVTIVSTIEADVAARNKIEADILFTKGIEHEEDSERGIPRYLELEGAVFNFRKEILPMKFNLYNSKGIDFILGELDQGPYFVKAFGHINNVNSITKIEEESAWGEPIVKEVTKTRKEVVIDNMAGVPYPFGDEGTLTVEEVKKAKADREIKLAAEKNRAIEYQNSKNDLPFSNAQPKTATATTVKNESFQLF